MSMVNVTVLPCDGFQLGLAGRSEGCVPKGRLKIAHIQAAVAAFYDIPVLEMTSARRSRQVARPRQVAMYLAKQLTPKSLPDIGRRFGGRDHTTVIHAVRTITQLIDGDGEFAADVAALQGVLERGRER